jgi:hypothetical protein
MSKKQQSEKSQSAAPEKAAEKKMRLADHHVALSVVSAEPVTRLGVRFGPEAKTVQVPIGSSAHTLLLADAALTVTEL